jgi:hypothetical protein
LKVETTLTLPLTCALFFAATKVPPITVSASTPKEALACDFHFLNALVIFFFFFSFPACSFSPFSLLLSGLVGGSPSGVALFLRDPDFSP